MTEKVTRNLTSHEHSQLILSMLFWPPALEPDWLSLNSGSTTTLDKL